jgi:hypothetical protein
VAGLDDRNGEVAEPAIAGGSSARQQSWVGCDRWASPEITLTWGSTCPQHIRVRRLGIADHEHVDLHGLQRIDRIED